MIWLAAYTLAGVIVFFGLRAAFREAKIDPKPHDRIWVHWLMLPEGWIFAIPFWPLLGAASVCCFVAELIHASGTKEIHLREEDEAKREKKYDHLTLDQKIDLLEAENQRRK